MLQFNYLMMFTRLVAFISIVFISFSCVDYFKKDDVVFEVVNNSDYDITISYFLDHKELDSFTIASKEIFSRTLGGEAPYFNPSREFEIDSITVNFENQRALLFYCPEDLVFTSHELKCLKFFEGQKNPYWFAAEGETTIDKRTYIPTHTITYDNSDFDRAIPL